MAGVVASPLVMPAVTKSTTSYTLNIQLTTTAGVPVVGKVFNTANLIASYAGEKLARVAITLADLAAITTAWTTGGFKEIDATNMPGWYRLDVPNAALDLAGGTVLITINDDADCNSAVIIPIPAVTVATHEAKTDLLIADADFVDVVTVRTDN